MDMYFFFVFSNKKNQKKKYGAEKGLGYCPTVSQYNGKLYCDTAGFRRFEWLVGVLQWGELYCNIGRVVGREHVTIHFRLYRDRLYVG